MSLLDDFSKGFVIYIGILSVLAIIGLISAGQATTSLLLFVVLFIPLSMVALEYYGPRKKGFSVTLYARFSFSEFYSTVGASRFFKN